MYALYFTLLIIGGFSAGKSLGRAYFFLMMMLLLALIGLRSPLVGADTAIYIRWFDEIGSLTYDGFLNRLENAREPLYIALTWAMGQASSSYVLYLFSWALFPCIAIFWILKKELLSSLDYMVAILCMFSLNFVSFFMAGIRQTAAISLLFFSYQFLKKIDLSWHFSSFLNRNMLMFLLCVVLAFLVHNSSVVILLVLPFLKMKIRWWYLPVAASLFFAGNLVSVGWLQQLASTVFEERFSSYGENSAKLSVNGFIMQFILFTVCFLRYVKLREKDKTNTYLFNLVLVGLFFQSLSGVLAEMFRMSYYFSIYYMILVPRAIREYSPITRIALYPAFAFLLLLYLFSLSGGFSEYSSSVF